MGTIRRRIFMGVAAAASFALLAPASAYDFDQAKVKIAKEKGTITWYTSVFPEELRLALAEDFRKQTGLDLVIGFAGGTGQVTTRIATERKVGSAGMTFWGEAFLKEERKQKTTAHWSPLPSGRR